MKRRIAEIIEFEPNAGPMPMVFRHEVLMEPGKAWVCGRFTPTFRAIPKSSHVKRMAECILDYMIDGETYVIKSVSSHFVFSALRFLCSKQKLAMWKVPQEVSGRTGIKYFMQKRKQGRACCFERGI